MFEPIVAAQGVDPAWRNQVRASPLDGYRLRGVIARLSQGAAFKVRRSAHKAIMEKEITMSKPQRVLVFGGVGGIGEALTKRLVGQGAHVVITSRSRERVEAAAAQHA
ncbi:MAG: SDR family NAD(P)-dependent oxidoreductase, partial [Pseudomonadota bacterium]